MINLDFIPSRQLGLYMTRLFLTRSLAVLVMLVLVLMALDLLGESGKILKVPGNGEAELWRYVSLRVPLLVSRFLPFSLLLGTLIAFTALNQNSETVAMKAAGLSAHQILAPLVLASLGVAIATFAFNETVVVKAARTINAWTDADYHRVPPDSGVLSNVWLRNGEDLVHAGRVVGSGPSLKLEDVAFYDRNAGRLVSVTRADSATQAAGAWKLSDVTTYHAEGAVVRHAKEQVALQGIEPSRFTLAKVEPAELDFLTLHDRINELEAAGRQTDEARTGWWHKLSGPASAMLMPILAALAAFGLARSGQVLLRAVTGMAMGFAFFVVDNIGIAMGNAGAYPPVLAAWAPFLLFLLIGEMVLIRTEE